MHYGVFPGRFTAVFHQGPQGAQVCDEEVTGLETGVAGVVIMDLSWYRDLVTALPTINNGMITVPPGPGLGMELHPDLDRAFTTSRRMSDATTV